jgi:ATP-dependent exoDNAse (exonuclease V) beta subunit
MVEEILKKLDFYNNTNFKFDPKKHRYTYEGQQFISVTQFISLFHEKFDNDYWSKYKSEQLGIPQEEILKNWKELNDRSNFIGTSTHNWIESYFKRIYQELPTDIDVIDRINKFNVAYCKYLYKLTPVKFEQRIFSIKWKIAGMIDSIFLYKDKVIMIDYKTNKDFTTDEHHKGRYENLLSPFENFYKNHLTEYSIQVSLYSLILEEIGIKVEMCYLLHIGPDSEAKMYKFIDMKDILREYLNNQHNI